MNITLTQRQIVRCITDAGTPAQAITNLYKLAYPFWGDLERLEGYPRVSEATGTYIVQAGNSKFESGFTASWVDMGFVACEMSDWQVDTSHTTLVWRKDMRPDTPVTPKVRERFTDNK